MLRWTFVLVACATMAAGCSDTPTGPDGARVPTLSRTRFLAFGDSLTAGEVTAPVGSGVITDGGGTIFKQILVPSASYPTVLQSQLTARYTTQSASITVVNAGLPGENVLNGAARFPDALTANAPEVVLVMEGVNGISLIGPDASTDAVRTMVVAAKARGARVFVGSMLPTIAGRQRSQSVSDLEAYNSKLQQMAAAEGVTYVDLYTPLLPEALTVIGVDGLHPTEAGYRRMADIFFSAIQTNLEVTSR